MNKNDSPPAELETMEAAVAAHANTRYLLKLYVIGTTPRSTKAIVNIRKICEEHLQGRYDLEVVDISQHPTLAEGRANHRRADLDQKAAAALAPLHRRHVADRAHPARARSSQDS